MLLPQKLIFSSEPALLPVMSRVSRRRYLLCGNLWQTAMMASRHAWLHTYSDTHYYTTAVAAAAVVAAASETAVAAAVAKEAASVAAAAAAA